MQPECSCRIFEKEKEIVEFGVAVTPSSPNEGKINVNLRQGPEHLLSRSQAFVIFTVRNPVPYRVDTSTLDEKRNKVVMATHEMAEHAVNLMEIEIIYKQNQN